MEYKYQDNEIFSAGTSDEAEPPEGFFIEKLDKETLEFIDRIAPPLPITPQKEGK